MRSVRVLNRGVLLTPANLSHTPLKSASMGTVVMLPFEMNVSIANSRREFETTNAPSGLGGMVDGNHSH